jgi:endonuclease/exonuclease/phosphatase family metal-dependent hydrolase
MVSKMRFVLLAVLTFAGCIPPQEGLTDPDRLRPFHGGDADGGALIPDLGAVTPDAAEVIEPDRQVSVATFNVKRFFDTQCQSGQCGAGAFEGVYSQSEFEARARRIANGVIELDADILLLQEFETEACLNELVSLLGTERYPVAIIAETGGTASLDVAVMAKGSLIKTVKHRQDRIPQPGGGTTTFSRELLEVHLDVGGHSVIAFNAHYKSKNNDDARRRLAEAMASREIVLAAAEDHPESLVVLGGDLNDTPGSSPLDALEAGGDLIRVASELEDSTTHVFNGRPIALDHLYWAETEAAGYMEGSAEVVRNGERGHAGSDHAALRAVFFFRE